MLSAKHGFDLLPSVIPVDTRPLDDPGLSAALRSRAEAAGWNGYRIDLGTLSGGAGDRWREATDAWRRPFYRAGLRLAVGSDTEQEARP
jgi:hypothetical protein